MTRKAIFAISTLALCAGLCAPALTNAQPRTPPPTHTVTIQIDATKHAPYTIPRTIFGTFLEPIGNAIYNGLWAEILQNPSFERGLWNAESTAHMLADQPSLGLASHLDLPLPWEPVDASQANRYEPRFGDAANSGSSLAIFGLQGRQTGVKQRVYLPVARQLRYKGSIYSKHLSGPAGLTILLTRHDHSDQVLSRAHFETAPGEWHKSTFELSLQKGQAQPLEPLDFLIEVQDEGRVLVDEASLVPADAVDGLDPDLVAMAKALKTPLLRFGGNFTSGYHWRDGVGPIDKRVSMPNLSWGMPEYNQFGTDEFLNFCRSIGAQPQIALNLGSGTADEAGDWVRYVNEHWPTHQGLLWELGNELWGSWNIGYPTLGFIAQRTVEFSQAIRKVDPTARLIATGDDPDDYREWNSKQMPAPPNTFDFLSTHFVVETFRAKARNVSRDFLAQAAFALPVELGRRLHLMQTQLDEAHHPDVHFAFTEWLFANGGTNKGVGYDNMGGAISAAGMLNMLIQNAPIVPIANMTGIIEFAGISKKRGRAFAAPTYYAFQLYSTADAHTPVDVTTDSETYDVHDGMTRLPDMNKIPYLEVVAALNEKEDRLMLFCINRQLSQDLQATISVAGFNTAKAATAHSLSARSIYDANTEEHPDLVKPTDSKVPVTNSQLRYTFPYESVTRIDLER